MEGLRVLSCTPGTNRFLSRSRELAKREQTNFQVAGLQYEILIVTNTKYAAMQHVVAKHTASCHGTIRWHRDAIGSLVKNCFPCLVLELTNCKLFYNRYCYLESFILILKNFASAKIDRSLLLFSYFTLLFFFFFLNLSNIKNLPAFITFSTYL